ncbi:hypothetical protein PMAC_000254 [Pneumocystis sp. 'macacae']|nr:hypothetical protein PMAC_000254 [Pneumocystis sp. 'macacae']
MSNIIDNKDSIVLEWIKQSTKLDERLCINLESKCFYLEKPCSKINIRMSNACTNLKSACLKTRLFRKNYRLFQALLRGKLHNLAEVNILKTCTDELLKLCNKKINIQNPILISFCLRPWDACRSFANDIERQSRELRIDLDWKRDFPNEENCKKLQEKCETLGQDSRMNELPCYTLKERCDHLKNAKELEEILLEKRVEKLSDLDVCIKKVSEICNNMSKRKRMGFLLSCIHLNTTCQMITRDVKFKCITLGKNMGFMKALEKTKDMDVDKGPECDLWEPYCDKYMSNCEKLMQDNGNDGKCKELKKNCKSYRELQDKENAIMYKLQGSLNDKDKCQQALDEYCLDCTEMNNDAFKNLCTDNTDAKNDTARSELCKKLVKRIKERCIKLSMKLKSMIREIQKSVDTVKKLNEISGKALKSAKFTLNKQKAYIDLRNTTSILFYNANITREINIETDMIQENLSGYLKQKKTEFNITDKELEAFDMAAEALEAYTEVKVKCKNLLLECGFKEDCSEYRDSCKKIEETCSQLKPLKFKSSEKEVINQTIIKTITIVETNSDGTQKTITTGEQSASVYTTVSTRTKERWVAITLTYTHISTQISIVTSTLTLTSARQCKPINEGLRMSNWSLMKEDPVRAVVRAVKRRAQATQNDGIDEEHILALVLKKDNLEETPCKQQLKEYCEGLRKIDHGLDNIDEKLKETCKDHKTAEGKCTGLKDNVEKKCTPFKKQLETAIGDISKLTDDVCRKHEQQCLFLEAACETELKDKCIELRIACYQKKRDEVAEEVLLRALVGHLEDAGKCKERLKDVCPELGQESDELTKKCINLDYTCGALVEAAKKKCESLETEVGSVLTSNKLKENGHSLLEKCHFHGKNCKNKKPKCDELEKKYKEKGVVYVPPGSEFDPTQPEPTVAERIGLEELYQKAAAEGVIIGRTLEGDIVDLLVLLSEKENFDETKCKSVLETKCDSITHLSESIKELCGNKTGYTDKCEVFKKEFEKKKNLLTIMFENKDFKDNIVLWSKLPRYTSDYDYIILQSGCFYFENQNSFGTPCKNVKAMCYKRGLDELANEALQEKLWGKFDDGSVKWFETFQKELVSVCKDLKGKSKELFALCVQPEEAIGVLLDDLRIKTNILQEHLDAKRDLPTRQHCTDLLKKCADLEQDSKHIQWPCRTLRHHCARLGVAEQLEEVFLQEKVSDLDKFESCVKTLTEKCNGWGRRGRTRYALGCVAPNATCTYLTQNVGAKCAVLGGRIQTEGVVEKAKKEKEGEKTGETCRLWMPYCKKFMYSCKNLTNDADKYCKGLEKQCETVIKQLELEEELLYELKGNLKEKKGCKTKLDGYCTEWANATNELKTLCTDEQKGRNRDDDVRNELCERLVERLKRWCPELKEKLTKTSEELKEKEGEYKEIKNKAEEAMKAADLVLVATKKADSKEENKATAGTAKNTAQFRLVKRNAAIKITEDKIKAFDLVSQAFSLYVELKEECEDSVKKCSFEKECEECKDACKKINEICPRVKPLDVKEHKKMQAYKMYDRGRGGRRGEAEWGAEDARVGREGGVVGDDDFGYDLEMGKYGLGWHVYLGNDECILLGRPPRTS